MQMVAPLLHLYSPSLWHNADTKYMFVNRMHSSSLLFQALLWLRYTLKAQRAEVLLGDIELTLSFRDRGQELKTLLWNRLRSSYWCDVGLQFFCLHNGDNRKCLFPRIIFKLNQNNVCISFSFEPWTLIAQQMLAVVPCWPSFLYPVYHSSDTTVCHWPHEGRLGSGDG